MAMVNFWYNTRAKYNAAVKDPETLYFCKDTRELFKGNESYSEGVRFVANYTNLPMLATAADGVIYVCQDTNEGYVINRTAGEWVKVTSTTTQIEVDNETIELNTSGLIAVKAVPIAKITGLEDRLSNIESVMTGGIHFKGSVETVEALPADAVQGDFYQVTADGSEWCYNGTEWFEFGTPGSGEGPGLELDTEQFVVTETGVATLASVPCNVVKYNDEPLANTLDEVTSALTWQDVE